MEAVLPMPCRNVRRLPVLNREQRAVGIISLGDLARETTAEIAGGALGGIAEPGATGRRDAL